MSTGERTSRSPYLHFRTHVDKKPALACNSMVLLVCNKYSITVARVMNKQVSPIVFSIKSVLSCTIMLLYQKEKRKLGFLCITDWER